MNGNKFNELKTFELFVIIRSIRLIFGGIYADQSADFQGV